MAFVYKCPYCQNEFQLRNAITVTQRKCSICKGPIEATEAQRQEFYYFKQISDERKSSALISGIKWFFILAIPFTCCLPFLSNPKPIDEPSSVPTKPNAIANTSKDNKNGNLAQEPTQPKLKKNDAAEIEAINIIVNLEKLGGFLKSPIESGKPTELQIVALGGIKGGIKELDDIAPQLSGKFSEDAMLVRNYYNNKYLPMFKLYLSKPETIPEKNPEPEMNKPINQVESMKKIEVVDEKKKAHEESILILNNLESLESIFKKSISIDDPEKPSPNQTAARNGIKRGLGDLSKLIPKLPPEVISTITKAKAKYEALLKQ